MATGTTTPAALGECTTEDLADLDEKAAAFREAEEKLADARKALGETLASLLEGRGAQRKALAERLKVNDQTVSNIAYGRPGRK